MESTDIRYNNLVYWAAKKGRSTLADLCGWDGVNYINRMMKRYDNVGTKTARKLETALELGKGWFDLPHPELWGELEEKDRALLIQGGVEYLQFLAPESPAFLSGRVQEQFVAPVNHIPLVSWEKVGLWCDSPHSFRREDAEEWLPEPGNVGRYCFALKVVNDAMTSPFPGARSYPIGTIIYVDPARLQIDGARVVARVGGNYTFKSYVEDAGKKYLKPLNPTYDKTEIASEVRIMGVVVGSYLPE